MAGAAVSPSLIVFGPLSFLASSAERLENIRQTLRQWPHSGPIVHALQTLEFTWHYLQAPDSGLSIGGSNGHLASMLLSSSLTGSGPSSDLSAEQEQWNAIIVPMLVLTHVLHYLNFCKQNGFAHKDLAEDVRGAGGFQGCCGGMLSALAIAAAKDEEDIARTAAWAIQVAFAVGCWIDADDDEQKRNQSDTAMLAVRWKTDMDADKIFQEVNKHDGAYVAIVLDKNKATLTVPRSSQEDLTTVLSGLGVVARECRLAGRYHTVQHAHVIQKIRHALPASIEAPAVGFVRSNATGQVIDDGDLSRVALQCIIAQKAEWLSTITAAASSLDPERGAWVLMIGSNVIPSEMDKAYHVVTRDTSQPVSPLATDGARLPEYPDHSVAVVGMACRLPEANSPDELWNLLVEGMSTLRPMPEGRFDPNDNHPRAPDDMRFWGNFLGDIKGFDHKFFDRKPREAVSMDPQQRIMLEVAYEALQSSAYFSTLPTNHRERSIGCYIGACATDYDAHIASHPPTAYSTTGVLRAFLSGKISHHFGFSGPAITLDTACSSSAVAIHGACAALQTGEISAALAGGAAIHTSSYIYENLDAAQFLSPTGATKPFDAAGDGYCRGEGIALVVLKRLSDAIRDGDHIHGVIVASAINQGDNCVPITVPHSPSQAQLYRAALMKSGLDAKAMTFVEAHGTGTAVGDPVEMESIREVFGGHDRATPLYVSSVKGNIGHLEGASGVAALIKALLQMRHRTMPPQASFKMLNSRIPALEPDRICIPTKTVPLAEGKITACVNNYGAAGSNATLMLAEAPPKNQQQDGAEPEAFPIRITAACPKSIERNVSRLHTWLEANKKQSSRFGDVALSVARHADHGMPYSVNLVATDMADLMRQVSDTKGVSAAITKRPDILPLVLCFGGQTRDRVGLDRTFRNIPSPFRFHLDHCDEILRAKGFSSIYPAIFHDEPIEDVVVLHSALFAVQYASAMSWLQSGLQIDAVIGHSFGQLTALVVSGSLSVEDGIQLVAGRASLVKRHWGPERGVMIAINASANQISEVTEAARNRNAEARYETACYNGDSSHVVVCDEASTAQLEPELEASSIRFKTIGVPYGFHSRFTEPLLDDLHELAASLHFQSPTTSLEFCTLDETPEIVTPAHIVSHTRDPVHFSTAVDRLRKRLGACTWLEAGSSSGVMTMIRSCAATNADPRNEFLSQQLERGASKAVASTTSALWSRGYSVNCWFFHKSVYSQYRVLSVPTYSWDHSPHWLEQRSAAMVDQANKSILGNEALESRPTPQLLTALPPEDKNLQRYTVSTTNEEYRKLSLGFDFHSNLPAPVTIALEIIAAALIKLDINITDTLPESININAPNVDMLKCQDLILSLEQAVDGWTFAFISSGASNQVPYSQGRIKKSSADNTVEADLARYERLVPVDVADEVFNDRKSDRLQGRILYTIFSGIGHYPIEYQLVQSVAVLGNTVVGEISAPPVPSFRPMQCIECFLQVAAIHANCLQHDLNLSSRYRLVGIESIKWRQAKGSSGSSPCGWKVVCSISTSQTIPSYDCFVYDLASGRLHVVILGALFGTEDVNTSTPQTAGTVEVTSATQLPPSTTEIPVKEDSNVSALSQRTAGPGARAPPKKTAMANQKAQSEEESRPEGECESNKKQSIYRDLCGLLEELADVPKEDFEWTATFDDLGVDSLLMMEAIRDISRMFHIEIPTADLEKLTDMNSMVTSLNGHGCVGSSYMDSGAEIADNTKEVTDSSSADSPATISTETSEWDLVDSSPSTQPVTVNRDHVNGDHSMAQHPTTMNAPQIFEGVRRDVQSYIENAGFADFWTRVYPAQRRLVLAYTAECFNALGCDLVQLAPGSLIPSFSVPAKHFRLLDRLCDILTDGGILRPGKERDGRREYVRTWKYLDATNSNTLYDQVLEAFPEHVDETELLNLTGSCLADCITGAIDVSKLLFANQHNKELMSRAHHKSPMVQATTALLAEFLRRTLKRFHSASAPTRKARILELDAGSGGIARFVVDFLTKNGIEFEYTFTDISSTLVSQAKKDFSSHQTMRFATWDCIEQPPSEYHSAFDVVISTNYLYAGARHTVENILPTLTEGGIFCLVEFTRSMYWFDLVFGLLDRWWSFDDGKRHVPGDETFWSHMLEDAGFKHVSWTDGESAEAQSTRLILATKESCSDLAPIARPITEKRAGIMTQQKQWLIRAGVNLYADIYLPKAPDPPETKRPIALLFHGGGHLLFGRKDIPMKHVRELLKRGFLPISFDYRLCPEVGLYEGPYMDCCAALRWAREDLPHLPLAESVRPDTSKLIAVGFSSAGQLAMSLGFTGPQQGIKPPDAVFALYAPTDLEHEHWDAPCYPDAAEEDPQDVDDVLSGVQDHHITEHAPLNSRKVPSLSLTLSDPRARIVLHMNWKAQGVRTLLHGLPSKAQLAQSDDIQLSDHDHWKSLPAPSDSEVREMSPLAHVRDGTYTVPTFLVHGARDDWLPSSMNVNTRDEMERHGVPVGLIIPDQCGHAFDMFPVEDPLGVGWQAIEKGYDWICGVLREMQ